MKLKNKKTKKSKSYSTIAYETYTDFAENTSIHGLKYTVMKKTGVLEKLFWAAVLLVGLGASIYLTFIFWERYVSKPTRTKIKSFYAPTTTIEFPAVTLCNVNRLLDSKVDNFIATLDVDELEKENFKNALPLLLSFTDSEIMDYDEKKIKFLQYILDRNNMSNISFIMEKLSQNCSDMVKYCAWNNEQIDCSKIFIESLSVDGYCCSFNYGSSEKKFPYNDYNGMFTGITVILDPMLQTVQYSSIQSSGFKVTIHDPFEYPGSLSITRMVSVGKASYLQIFGTRMTSSDAVKILPQSQRQCFYPDESELESFDEYTSSNCLTECEAYIFFKSCGCVPYYFNFLNKPQCNFSKISCVLEIYAANYDLVKICECPDQCEDVYYNVLSVYSTFSYKECYTLTTYGNTTISDDSILLNVFFNEQTQSVYLRDTIFSTVYLLSSFGAVYSLFMGCSLISVVEIIYYCIVRFFVKVSLSERDETINKIHVKTVHNFITDPNFNPTYLP